MRLSIPALLLLATVAAAADPKLHFEIQMVDASGDAAMFVFWVEKADGSFVKTLQMCSKDKKYYKEVSTWWDAHEASKESIDAVVGATVGWGQTRQFDVPVNAGGVNLLGGDLVLRIEQRKDKGGWFKKVKIPLTKDWKGVTLEEGTAPFEKGKTYIKKLTVTVVR